MDDRRSEERLEVSLDAVWDGKSGNHTARITDLSEGGCFVDTLGQADIGEQLNLRFQLSDGSWLELSGEVAHHLRPVGFGLRFNSLSDQQLERLRSFLTSDGRANLS
jgi:Tfp pilus assembly protein PilZ